MSLMMTWTSCSRRCSEQGACLPKSKPSLLNGFEENIDCLAPCAGRNWLQRRFWVLTQKTIPHVLRCMFGRFWSTCSDCFFFLTPLTHDVSSYLVAAPMPGPVAARAHHSDRLCDLCRRAVFGGSVWKAVLIWDVVGIPHQPQQNPTIPSAHVFDMIWWYLIQYFMYCINLWSCWSANEWLTFQLSSWFIMLHQRARAQEGTWPWDAMWQCYVVGCTDRFQWPLAKGPRHLASSRAVGSVGTRGREGLCSSHHIMHTKPSMDLGFATFNRGSFYWLKAGRTYVEQNCECSWSKKGMASSPCTIWAIPWERSGLAIQLVSFRWWQL